MKILIALILTISPLYASAEKPTILDILESNSVLLNKSANGCLLAIKSSSENNKIKTCGIAALISMEYSAYVGSMSAISERELSDMVDIYLSKHGNNGLIQNQKIINEGAKTSKKIINLYKSMLLN